MIVFLSILFSSMAAITGILAIGSGRHWQFTNMDYLRGKRNAILYLWVTVSTIFSMCHSGVLSEYALTYNWALRVPEDYKWFILHSVMGFLLVAAHIFVAGNLRKEPGVIDKYLWGKRRAV